MQDNSQPITVIILAAGNGKRMNSTLPKVLHTIGLRPMLQYSLQLSTEVTTSINIKLVVNSLIKNEKAYQDLKNSFAFEEIVQKEQLGTGDAIKSVLLANDDIDIQSDILVLYGDTPLISLCNIENMKKLLQEGRDLCLSAFITTEPQGYGRVITDKSNSVLSIVEEDNTDAHTKKIQLCNSGIMMMKASLLENFISKNHTIKVNKEFYLTDIAAFAKKNGYSTSYVETPKENVMGVNTRPELVLAENIIQKRIQNRLLSCGVTLIRPDTSYFAYDIKAEQDVTIYPHVFIGPGTVLKQNSLIYSFSHIQGCIISANASIGPYARIRPNTLVAQNAKIGNFVEIKNSVISKNSKISHMSYVGDVRIGENVNIGAGTIFCNYDGNKKNTSHVKSGSFIGANSTIISPVVIEENATVAAGSVINMNVEKDSLAIARSKQKNLSKKSIIKNKC